MERDDFLARVRHSLDPGNRLGDLEPARRAGGAQPEPAPAPYRPPAPPPRAEMVELLIREHEAVGGVAVRVRSAAEACRHVVAILADLDTRQVIRGDTPRLRELELDAELASAGIGVTIAGAEAAENRDALRQAAFAADAGITSVDFGVAETGTLALLAAPGQGRAVSLLPPVHIAVLDARDIVYELAALFEQAASRGAMPSALTFVTGPSRTGDIEQTLTVGVHGPGDLQLIVID